MSKLLITTALSAFIFGSFNNPVFASDGSGENPPASGSRASILSGPVLARVAEKLHELVTLSSEDATIKIVDENSPHINYFLTEYAGHVATQIANYETRTEVENHVIIMDILRTLQNLPTQANNIHEYIHEQGTVVQTANTLYAWANSDSCPPELKDLTLKGVVGVYEFLCFMVSLKFKIDVKETMEKANIPDAVDAILPSLLETRSPYYVLLNSIILDTISTVHALQNVHELDDAMSRLTVHIENPTLATMPFFRATLKKIRANLFINSMIIIYKMALSPTGQVIVKVDTSKRTIPPSKIERFKSDLERTLLTIEELRAMNVRSQSAERADAIADNMAARLLSYPDKLDESEYYKYSLILAQSAKGFGNSIFIIARTLAMAALRAPDRDTEQRLLEESYDIFNSFGRTDNAFKSLCDITRERVEQTLPMLSEKEKKRIAKSQQTSEIDYESTVNINYNIRLIVTAMLGRYEECLKLLQDKIAYYEEQRRTAHATHKKRKSGPNIEKIKAEIRLMEEQQAAVQARLEARRAEDERRAALRAAAYTSQPQTHQYATPQERVTVPQAEIRRELAEADATRKVRRSDAAAASSADAPAEEEMATAHVISQKTLDVIRRNEETYRAIFDPSYPSIKRSVLQRLFDELNGTIRRSNDAHVTSALRLDTFAPQAVEDTDLQVEVLRYLASNGSEGTMTMSSNHGSRFLSRPQIDDVRIILAMNGLEPIKVERALAERGAEAGPA